MAIQQATVPAKNFRSLIRDVLKFPPSASVAASEVVHFSVAKGRARASVAGVVTSAATVLATRELDAFTADYRSLSSYAELLSDDATVNIEVSQKDNMVRFVCGNEKLELALTLGSVLPKPKMPDPFFVATAETVRALKWLASVAEKDEAKQDMCCVYLKDGAAMAGNQNCIAVARTPGLPDIELPLPLQLCKVIEPGDRLARAEGGLLLASGCVVAQIPYLVSSIRFPVKTVEKLESAKGSVYGRCSASVMGSVFKKSADCVARIPNVNAFILLTFKGGKINLKAESQTATFRTVLDGAVEKDGDLWLELPEAEDVITVLGDGDVICSKLEPKGETVLEGTETKAFFAPRTKA